LGGEGLSLKWVGSGEKFLLPGKWLWGKRRRKDSGQVRGTFGWFKVNVGFTRAVWENTKVRYGSPVRAQIRGNKGTDSSGTERGMGMRGR